MGVVNTFKINAPSPYTKYNFSWVQRRFIIFSWNKSLGDELVRVRIFYRIPKNCPNRLDVSSPIIDKNQMEADQIFPIMILLAGMK